MKKISTAARKQSRNISQQTLTIGLDLGDRNSWYCVVDEAGQIQLEQQVRTNAKALQEVFGANSLSTRLIHGECVPVSNAIRLRGGARSDRSECAQAAADRGKPPER